MDSLVRLCPDKVKPGYQEYALLVDSDHLLSRVNVITSEETISSLGEVLTEQALYSFLASAESMVDGTAEGIRKAFNVTRVMGAMCSEIISLKKSVSFLEDLETEHEL